MILYVVVVLVGVVVVCVVGGCINILSIPVFCHCKILFKKKSALLTFSNLLPKSQQTFSKIPIKLAH